jgi:hypothetical protein
MRQFPHTQLLTKSQAEQKPSFLLEQRVIDIEKRKEALEKIRPRDSLKLTRLLANDAATVFTHQANAPAVRMAPWGDCQRGPRGLSVHWLFAQGPLIARRAFRT